MFYPACRCLYNNQANVTLNVKNKIIRNNQKRHRFPFLQALFHCAPVMLVFDAPVVQLFHMEGSVQNFSALILPTVKMIPLSPTYNFLLKIALLQDQQQDQYLQITQLKVQNFVLREKKFNRTSLLSLFVPLQRADHTFLLIFLPFAPNNLQTNTSTRCPFRSCTALYFFPTPLCPVAIHSALQTRVHAHLIPLLPPQQFLTSPL